MDWIRNIIRKRRNRGLALLSVPLLALGPVVMETCAPAPQTCSQKPGAPECARPYVKVASSGTSGNAYAGKQFLQEISQTLLRVELVCSNNPSMWTAGHWTNADGVGGPTVSAYWSCYPYTVIGINYRTAHS